MELEILRQILGKLEELKSGQQKILKGIAELKNSQQRLEAGQQKLEADIAATKKNTDCIPFLEQSILKTCQNIRVYKDLLEQTQTTENLRSPHIKNKSKQVQKTANLKLL